MRKLTSILATIVFTTAWASIFSACEREDARPLINISGEFTNTPDLSAGFIEVLLPPEPALLEPALEPAGKPEEEYSLGKNNVPMVRRTVLFPVKYFVAGTWTCMEQLDITRSVLTCSSATFDPEAGAFKGNLHITLSDIDGSQLFLGGTFVTYPDFSNKSFLQCEGGSGKFVSTEGWMTAIGSINPQTGANALTVFGEMTAPLK
jgi:hypothetical protein